ncbi:hypothetical protein B0H21DRAFT_537444 [Amylocystis lapponica]|nr:hypothetical protein B0H21DRAFT_537444 [Amylocystis lapponica]
MPKASTSARPALRRNQACLACRKRKLKCDAARPHCGTCFKQWQALISVPPPVGYAHPTEPQCSYDPVEGLPISPDVDPVERIHLLEEQISSLKSQLRESRSLVSHSSSPPRHLLHRSRHSLTSSNARTPDDSPPGGGIGLPNASLDMVNSLSSGSPESQFRGSSGSGSPDTQRPGSGHSNPWQDLLYSGWDPDLPDPEPLNHFIDVFFKCDPCGSHVLHRPSFLASMHLHPSDPNFPHRAILHAICASASRWTSQDIVTLPDGVRRDRFAEFHVSKTRTYIDRTMATGQDIFPVLQACILLSWYFYQEGRWVEIWIFAGFQTRVAVPLRLNYPGTFVSQGSNSLGAYLEPAKDFKDLESRRRTFWMSIMYDRIVSVGGWLHGVDEQDIGTELPLRSIDFETDSGIASNPQNLKTKDVFIRHPPLYTDSFLLFLKSVMLFGRVTDYNTRTGLHNGVPSRNQNPFHLPNFEELDQLVCLDFLEHFPPDYKHLGVGEDGGSVDTDLYMAHIVPHAATITLHNPFLNFSDPSSISTARCLHATRSILTALYKLSETSLDTTRLHPFVTICWYLAAVVQIQLCKYFIEIGDSPRESTVWGEINILRFAMLTYGARSPIGIRQEKLLQGLMTEIVRMTSQMQPLEVGVPLYPFSHATLWQKDTGHPPENTITPLPGHFEDIITPVQSVGVGMSRSPQVQSHPTVHGWTMHESPSPPRVTHSHSHLHPTVLSDITGSYPVGH